MNRNLKIATLISGVITIIGVLLAYRDSAWGNLIWPGLVLTVSVGLVNVHGEGTQSGARLIMWSGILSFLVYTGVIYVVLNWLSRSKPRANR